jgi:hypothetical protein
MESSVYCFYDGKLCQHPKCMEYQYIRRKHINEHFMYQDKISLLNKKLQSLWTPEILKIQQEITDLKNEDSKLDNLYLRNVSRLMKDIEDDKKKLDTDITDIIIKK